MSLGSGALPASGHHSAIVTVLVWMREWRVTQVPPERPSTSTTSDFPKQSSKCPVGSHLRELTLSCRVKGGRVEWSIREEKSGKCVDSEGNHSCLSFVVVFWRAFLYTNLEDRQHYRLLILIGLSCGQKDLSTGVAHCERLVLTVPGDTLRS